MTSYGEKKYRKLLKENKKAPFSLSASSCLSAMELCTPRITVLPIQNFKAVFSMRLKFPTVLRRTESGRTVGLCMRASE